MATGSHWTTDGLGRARNLPSVVEADAVVVGADTVLAGAETPSGRAVIFDDDHCYPGPVIALALRARGNAETLVTPAGRTGQWCGCPLCASHRSASSTVSTLFPSGTESGLSIMMTGTRSSRAATSFE